MANNFIIHQKAREYEWSGDCFLSVKSFYDGKANYKVKQREYSVDQSNFLILNECTRYRLIIDSFKPTESFCVFFSPEYVLNFMSFLEASDEELLDFKLKTDNGIKLFERNYKHSGEVSSLLKIGKIKSAKGFATLEKDEYYHQLLLAILKQNDIGVKESSFLDFKKQSTKREIYQRVIFAKDFIDSNYFKNFSLKELSEASLLSENHLLRNFRKVFQTTPFQYLSTKRISEAKKILLKTDKSISQIATDVGYSSFTNFSYYFKSLTGKSPSAFRKSDM